MVTTSYPRYEGDFAGAFLYQICKELGKFDVEVMIVAPNDAQSKRDERHGNVEIKRFNYFMKSHQGIAYGYGGILENIRKKPWLVLILPFFLFTFFTNVLSAARRCDLIHANWIPTGYMSTFIKLLLRKPLILTVRGKDINLYKNKRGAFHILSRIFFPRVDLFTTVSDEFAHFLKDEPVVRPEKVHVIPNGVSNMEIDLQHLEGHKLRYGIPQDGLKAIYVGSLTELKGVRWLVQAWRLVVKEYPEAMLLIIGDGDDRKHLEGMARKFNLEKGITFYGYQQTHTIPYWLACADIFVLPSLFEGRPNVLLEAFQSQLPVVATDIAGIRELLQDGANGFLVPVENPEALASKILELFSSEEIRKKMGKAGKDLIRARGLTWGNCAKRYHELYKHMLSA
jgi:glycosyltransferase involved in cell wall biosynthesis